MIDTRREHPHVAQILTGQIVSERQGFQSIVRREDVTLSQIRHPTSSVYRSSGHAPRRKARNGLDQRPDFHVVERIGHVEAQTEAWPNPV